MIVFVLLFILSVLFIVNLKNKNFSNSYYILLFSIPFLLKFFISSKSINIALFHHISMVCFIFYLVLIICLFWYRDSYMNYLNTSFLLEKYKFIILKLILLIMSFILIFCYMFVLNITDINNWTIDNLFSYIYITYIIKFWNLLYSFMLIEFPDKLLSEYFDRLLGLLLRGDMNHPVAFFKNIVFKYHKLSLLLLIFFLRILLFDAIIGFTPILIFAIIIIIVLLLDINLVMYPQIKYNIIIYTLYLGFEIFILENFILCMHIIILLTCIYAAYYLSSHYIYKTFYRKNINYKYKFIIVDVLSTINNIQYQHGLHIDSLRDWKIHCKRDVFTTSMLLIFVKCYSYFFKKKININVYFFVNGHKLRIVYFVPNHKFILGILHICNKKSDNLFVSFKGIFSNYDNIIVQNDYMYNNISTCIMQLLYSYSYFDKKNIYCIFSYLDTLNIKLVNMYYNDILLCYIVYALRKSYDFYYHIRYLSVFLDSENVSIFELLKYAVSFKYDFAIQSQFSNSNNNKFFNLTCSDIFSLINEISFALYMKISNCTITLYELSELKHRISSLMTELNKFYINDIFNINGIDHIYKDICIHLNKFIDVHFCNNTLVHKLYIMEFILSYENDKLRDINSFFACGDRCLINYYKILLYLYKLS